MSLPEPINPMKDFVAGTVGGIAGIIAGHPFDTVKVRIQTQPTVYSGGTFQCLYQIAKKESVRGLYKGMFAPVIGVGFLSAICFGIYGNSLRALERWRGIPRSKLEYYTDVFLAGCVSGCVVVTLQIPSDLIKIRLQLQESKTQKQYWGPFDCAKKIYKAEGFRGLYTGMTATLLRDAGPGYGSYFYVMKC
jgi:solute carrier family 25 carnitine/acylcarnitine transporter 20/29